MTTLKTKNQQLTHFLLTGGEVDPDPRSHCFRVSKKDVKFEGERLQVFPLNMSKRGLQSEDDKVTLTTQARTETSVAINLTPMKEMIPEERPGGGLRTQTDTHVKTVSIRTETVPTVTRSRVLDAF